MHKQVCKCKRARAHTHTLTPTRTQFCSVASSISCTSSTHDRPKTSASQQRSRSPERKQAQMVSLIHSHARPRIMPGRCNLLGSGQVVQGGGAGAEDECVAQAPQRSLSAHAFAPSPPVHRHNVILAQASKYRCVGGDLVSTAHAHRGVEGEILRAMPSVGGRWSMPGPAGSKTKLRTALLVATKEWGGLC
jgi:hypothetical protein